MSKLAPILILILFTTASAQDCPMDAMEIKSIRAFDTDSTINWEVQNHEVYFNKDCQSKNQLVIHLVGSFGSPSSTTHFPILAAELGYHVINLKYPNSTAAVSACAASTDRDCFRHYRQEIAFGNDSSAAVEVDTSNCIVNRIEKLIQYLDINHPAENWVQFLTETKNPDWSKIILSGHSQGGGHAAYIAQRHEISRVLMFASPNDYSDHHQAPAEWLADSSMTDVSRFYAFGHAFDNVVDFTKQVEIWTEMHLFQQSDSTCVDNTFCIYDDSRILYTKLSNNSGIGNHSSVITDAATPLSNGIPIFAPVWKYMLGTCDDMSTSNTPAAALNSILVMPNPTSGLVRIESQETVLRADIFDLTGNMVRAFVPLQNTFELNLCLSSGLYFLRLTAGGSQTQYSHKLLIH